MFFLEHPTKCIIARLSFAFVSVSLEIRRITQRLRTQPWFQGNTCSMSEAVCSWRTSVMFRPKNTLASEHTRSYKMASFTRYRLNDRTSRPHEPKSTNLKTPIHVNRIYANIFSHYSIMENTMRFWPYITAMSKWHGGHPLLMVLWTRQPHFAGIQPSLKIYFHWTRLQVKSGKQTRGV